MFIMEVKPLLLNKPSLLLVHTVEKWASRSQHFKNMWPQSTVMQLLKWWALFLEELVLCSTLPVLVEAWVSWDLCSKLQKKRWRLKSWQASQNIVSFVIHSCQEQNWIMNIEISEVMIKYFQKHREAKLWESYNYLYFREPALWTNHWSTAFHLVTQ